MWLTVLKDIPPWTGTQIHSSLKLQITRPLPTLLLAQTHANTSLPSVEMQLAFKNLTTRPFAAQHPGPFGVPADVGKAPGFPCLLLPPLPTLPLGRGA